MSVIRDGDWRLFDHDFQTGRTVWVRPLPDGNDEFRVDYPVDATVAENAEIRNAAQKAWTGDWHRIASVPLGLYHMSGLADAELQNDKGYITRWLNDGDNRAWRTKEGRV